MPRINGWERVKRKLPSWIRRRGKGLDELLVVRKFSGKFKYALLFKEKGSYYATIMKSNSIKELEKRARRFIRTSGKS